MSERTGFQQYNKFWTAKSKYLSVQLSCVIGSIERPAMTVGRKRVVSAIKIMHREAKKLMVVSELEVRAPIQEELLNCCDIVFLRSPVDLLIWL